MIQVEQKQTIDNIVTIFVSDDEPLYKYAALFLKMLQKNYTTGRDRVEDISPIFNVEHNCYGNRIKFYRTANALNDYSYMTVKMSKTSQNDQLEGQMLFKIRNQGGYMDCKYEILFSDDYGKNPPIILKQYSRNMNTSKLFFPKIVADIEFRNDSSKQKKSDEDNMSYFDDIINKLIFFENNIKTTKTLGLLSSFCEPEVGLIKIKIREFAKLNKYSSIIDQIGMPTQKSRNRLLELCTILKTSNIIELLKIGVLTFIKNNLATSMTLKIKLSNFTLVHEKNFNYFKYLDHPGINFLADFLDKANLFDAVEARISKEIMTKM